jgi:hypothetical protein
MADKIHFYGDEPRGAVYGFECPGCKYHHTFLVGPNGWTWNGSLDKPTFSPSLLVNANTPQARCHSFVKDGKIEFLSDCFHALKGQTVDLPDWK